MMMVDLRTPDFIFFKSESLVDRVPVRNKLEVKFSRQQLEVEVKSVPEEQLFTFFQVKCPASVSCVIKLTII